MRNISYSDNTILDKAVEMLQSSLPGSWHVSVEPDKSRSPQVDAVLIIRSPEGAAAKVVAAVKRKPTPRMAADMAARLGKMASEELCDGAVLVSEYLSDLSRKRLRQEGIGYMDLTGNRWLALERPGLLVETSGAAKDPSPAERPIRTLKGAKAARIVRALCDTYPPFGVRELARMVDADPGYTSRVLDFLYSQDLIERGEAGEVVETRWEDMIRRWSQDYSLLDSHRAETYLAPRGLEDLFTRLLSYEDQYAITGSFAMPASAAIAAGRTAICFVRDLEAAAGHLQIRLAESGANVLVVEPFDRLVFDRVRMDEGLVKVALSQCAADLLTSGGRGPAEADALLGWMKEHEKSWRT